MSEFNLSEMAERIADECAEPSYRCHYCDEIKPRSRYSLSGEMMCNECFDKTYSQEYAYQRLRAAAQKVVRSVEARKGIDVALATIQELRAALEEQPEGDDEVCDDRR